MTGADDSVDVGALTDNEVDAGPSDDVRSPRSRLGVSLAIRANARSATVVL